MADDITVRDEGKKFLPHPEGQYAATCLDVVDLGLRVTDWEGHKKAQPRLALIFATGEVDAESRPFLLTVELTVSMGERANLRKFLESWRGKRYTDDEARGGVKLAKMVGHPALIAVEHIQTAAGRTFAKINSIMPLPKSMPKPAAVAYERPDWLADRKREYAEAYAEFQAATAKAAAVAEFDAVPAGLQGDPDDDLPF